MNIKTVLANLDNTIKGKRALLTKLRARKDYHAGDEMATHAVCEFLEINIAELERIHYDVALLA